MHTLHSNTDKIFNYSIITTCELHILNENLQLYRPTRDYQSWEAANPEE